MPSTRPPPLPCAGCLCRLTERSTSSQVGPLPGNLPRSPPPSPHLCAFSSRRRQTEGRRHDARHPVRLHRALGVHHRHPEEEPDPALRNGLRLQGRAAVRALVPNVWAPHALTDAFLRSSDHSLHLHPLPDQRPLGVPVDGLGDGESRVRTAGPTLRLHQEERRLVCLVQRGGTTQKGLHGHRRSLTALLSNLPRYQKTHFFLLVSVSAKHALSGAFLFAGLLVCFCACVLFLPNALMNPALSTPLYS